MRAIVADTEQLRHAAANLVSRQYAGAGLAGVHALPDGPHSVTLAVLDAGAVMGTMTLTFDSPAGLLADAAFRDEIDQRRAAGSLVCEMTKLAFDTAGRSMEALAALVQLAYELGTARGASDLFIEVHPRHAAFYQRMLGFIPVGGKRMNARVNAPAVLLCLDAIYVGLQIALHAGTAGQPDATRSLYPYFTRKGNPVHDGLCDAAILVARVSTASAEAKE